MDHAAFFAAVRPLFGGSLTQEQVDGMSAILGAWQRHGDRDSRKLAYILATARHETAAFRYMREIWGPTAAQKRYEGRKDLGNTLRGDGKKVMGRGFVQITGRRNYADWSKRLGVDLVKEPQLAERHELAASILVQGMMIGTFTTRSLDDYIDKNAADYIGARRIVNGTDRAALIAGYAVELEQALEAATSRPSPIPTLTKPVPAAQPQPAGKPGGIYCKAALAFAAFVAAVIWLVFFVKF